MTIERVPRSISQEIASLGVAISAAERGAEEAVNPHNELHNRFAVQDLEDLRSRWANERDRLREEHIGYQWHMFCTHLNLAADHFYRWARLRGD
jgi:hypothetical protein